MPPEDRPVKTTERCANHPSRATVGTCDVCGRPLCVECAVPVLGRVLGTECLPEVLGDEGSAEAPGPWRRRTVRPTVDRIAGSFLVVATLTSLLPWTRFSTGSGFAGAWAFDARWSMDVVIASVVTLGLWFALGRRPNAARLVAIFGGVAIAAGALLAILNPPPFTKPALAPWIALMSGLAAAVAGAFARSIPAPPHV